jgi:hypothetical protein
VVSASARGRSNQRKGGYHERKQGKRLGELTGFTFERNLEQRREADHLGDLLCSDDRWPFVIENKYRSQGNSIPAGAWEQACRTAFETDRWPSVIWQNGRTAPRCRVPLSVIGCAQGGYELMGGLATQSIRASIKFICCQALACKFYGAYPFLKPFL